MESQNANNISQEVNIQKGEDFGKIQNLFLKSDKSCLSKSLQDYK